MLSLHREYLKCWHPVLTLASFRSHRGLTFVHDVTWMFFAVLLSLRQTYKPYHQILRLITKHILNPNFYSRSLLYSPMFFSLHMLCVSVVMVCPAKRNTNLNVLHLCSFFHLTFILFSSFLPPVWGSFECDCIEQEERKRCGWICNCESSCKYLTFPPPVSSLLFHSRHFDRNTFVYHSLALKSQVTCWFWLLLRMTPVMDFSASGLWPKRMFWTFCSLEISVLMGTIGQKDFVPHCLDPQALHREAVLFCCGFLTAECGFPPENMSASLQRSGHRFCGLCLPMSRSQPCSGSWLSYNLSLSLSTCVFYLYKFIIPTVPP